MRSAKVETDVTQKQIKITRSPTVLLKSLIYISQLLNRDHIGHLTILSNMTLKMLPKLALPAQMAHFFLLCGKHWLVKSWEQKNFVDKA